MIPLARAGLGLACLALLGPVLGGCAEEGPEPESAPAPCATVDGGKDPEFWRLVAESCRTADDGDVRQARALRDLLATLEPEQVADFHRTLVRLNHALDTERLGRLADDACLPGTGLGDDLFTDFRSWVVAHGQAAYERVLARPEALEELPDLLAGCGSGEPFGSAAASVYADLVGGKQARAALPPLEPATAPRP